MLTKAVVVASAALVAMVLGLIGCSGQGAADRPGETLSRMLVALADGRYEDACRLTADADGRIEDGTRLAACTERMRVYAEGSGYRALRSLRDVGIPPPDVDGRRAEIDGAEMTGASAAFREGTFELVRIDQRWYVSSR
ncbi:hypothetical protein CLV56_1495 [Mumia flava]|uniref:DUF4878 domain-containing protein n=1 Tax=Mumia flava TaxID=1348852 RepID=A0A2M9BH45_9ACTN|nr:hypothetical protein [Mumia flava]PJJ57268.1 hypothetical protein CLV56_1495 [Mumia flava]